MELDEGEAAMVMSELIPVDAIEAIVGAKRHPTRHLGRAVSDEATVYILHSGTCRADHDLGVRDLRQCPYARALDLGIDLGIWEHWQDRPVVLGLGRPGLIPMRGASTDE